VFGEVAVLACDVVRWGGSSFDVRIEGSGEPKDGAVPGEAPAPRFTAVITYVSVVPHENRPTPVPAVVRDALSA
jgi:acyl-CoA thioesterase FadM